MSFRTSFLPLTRLIVALSALSLSAAAAHAQQRYTVTDLGTLGGDTTVAFGVNNSGHVAGYSVTSGSSLATRHAFVYRDGAIHDLGTLGGPVSDGEAVSDAGHVVGRASTTPGSDTSVAFLHAGGVMKSLGALPGDPSSIALGVNDSGQVVGLSEHDSNPDPFLFSLSYRGFLYTGGVMQDLSALVGGVQSRANAINNAGQVVGSYNFVSYPCGGSRAFLYSGGTVHDLGTLPGTGCSEATAVNDFGGVVGVASASNNTSPRLFFTFGDGLQDLGGLGPHRNGKPWGINDAGVIVGSFSVSEFASYAFVYDNGQFLDLNTLVPAGLGWQLHTATAVNDYGQIVCLGNQPGTLGPTRAFLLTPTVPVLLTEPNSDKAIALDSVTFVRDPFPLTTEHNFSADRRTRLTLLAREVFFTPGEPTSSLTVQAEDSQHRVFQLPVEHVGTVPGLGWLTQVTVRLPDELAAGGEVRLSLSLHGFTSNKGSVQIQPDAGGSD